jgi:hypothetical protein
MREEGVKTGRPAERPGVRESSQTTTSWREAGVGTISIYQAGDREKAPERLATRYFARMPEAGMETLFAQHGWAVDLGARVPGAGPCRAGFGGVVGRLLGLGMGFDGGMR